MDGSPVMMPEARQVIAALLVGLAGDLLVFGSQHSVIFPGVADVLETGIVVSNAITVVNASCEWRHRFPEQLVVLHPTHHTGQQRGHQHQQACRALHFG
jgi:hypothetical protein